MMQDSYQNVWFYRLKWAYLLSIVGILLLPIFYTIYISFNEFGFGAAKYEFTLDWYQLIFDDPQMLVALKWTAYLALATVASAIPLGLLAAKFYKRTSHKVVFVTLMLAPLFVPADILGSSLLVYFKNLNSAFQWLGATIGIGWFEHWFELGFLTALIGQIIYTLPYVFVVILITMSRYRVQQTEAARGCGATAWQAFWHVEFPQIRVGIFSACAFVVILSFNEYTRTALLKGGFDTFTSVLISQMLNTGMSEQSYAMAGLVSSLSMLVIGTLIIVTLARADRLERTRRAKAEPVAA